MIAQLNPLPGEQELLMVRANHTQGGRAVGGKLHVTNLRVVFVAHGFDQATGGHNWDCPRGAVTRVDIAPRGRNPFNGSLRKRLRITSTNDSHLFVVNQPRKFIDKLPADISHS